MSSSEETNAGVGVWLSMVRIALMCLADRLSSCHVDSVDVSVGMQAGANMIVSGSAVVRSTDPRQVMSLMRTTVVDASQRWHSHIITDL